MTETTDDRLSFGISSEDDWGDDDIICAYVNGVQVAGAVRLGDLYAEATGCRYHLVSHAVPGLKPLLCRDKEQAIAWLTFLADLYEGRHG